MLAERLEFLGMDGDVRSIAALTGSTASRADAARHVSGAKHILDWQL
jgi:hypothetical protein